MRIFSRIDYAGLTPTLWGAEGPPTVPEAWSPSGRGVGLTQLQRPRPVLALPREGRVWRGHGHWEGLNSSEGFQGK